MFAEVLLNGLLRQASQTNAPISPVLPAVAAQRWFLGGIEAHYNPPISAIKTITVQWWEQGGAGGAGVLQQKVYRWDFTKGAFVHNLPLLIHSDYNKTLTVELEAGGPGVTGFISAWVALV